MSPLRPIAAGVGLLACASTAQAADDPATTERIARLEQQLAEQREHIARLEGLLADQGALLARLVPQTLPQVVASQVDRGPAAPGVSSVPAARAPDLPGRELGIAGLDVSGDLRLREEFNFLDRNARDRTRTVLRARLRASYAVSDHITVGGQVATGDPDDPNSTDMTLSGFDDDLDLSLDQAWVRYTNGGLTLYGGKFPQIFARTDMLWDGDVVPQGIGGSYRIGLGNGASLDARAMYSIVDEASGGPDSHMIGGQAVVSFPLAAHWKGSLAAAYYRYRLESVAGADSGDIRTNLFADGRYLSGFRLVDGLATLTYSGFGEHWPVSLTADYVRNLGAAVNADTGLSLELAAGRTAEQGEWRLSYAYSRVGVDAVFAAFSQDNIAFGSNYMLHGANVSYAIRKNVIFDVNYYHYRLLDRAYAGPLAEQDWVDRLRLNILFNF